MFQTSCKVIRNAIIPFYGSYKMCNIPVLSIPQRILRKYEDNVECIKKGVLLPVISNQRMNAYLKEIADVCGIAKRLTTHVARHTIAGSWLSKAEAQRREAHLEGIGIEMVFPSTGMDEVTSESQERS